MEKGREEEEGDKEGGLWYFLIYLKISELNINFIYLLFFIYVNLGF